MPVVFIGCDALQTHPNLKRAAEIDLSDAEPQCSMMNVLHIQKAIKAQGHLSAAWAFPDDLPLKHASIQEQGPLIIQDLSPIESELLTVYQDG